jgi:hypothetical protein
MITTATAAFCIESGSEQVFYGSSIICEPVYYESLTRFEVTLRVISSATTSEIGRGYMQVTTTEVDAETGTGTGEYAPWFNALQKAVITKLSAYTGNASTVFTIV